MHRADEIRKVFQNTPINNCQILFYASKNYRKHLNKIAEYVAQTENMYFMNAYLEMIAHMDYAKNEQLCSQTSST